MTADPLKGFAAALEAIRSGGPLNDLERARYNSQRAAEMAKAEARRVAPSPQLRLGEAA